MGGIATLARLPHLTIACLAALLWVPAPAFAAGSGPAVSDPNAKLSVEGGRYDGEQSAVALGSLPRGLVPGGRSADLL
jgi:hypothetical protein